jgi:flagellin
MGQIGDLLARGRELAVQSANGTMNDQQRKTVNNEFAGIKSEIDRITQTTEFNGQKLLDGQLGPNAQNPVAIQAGINNSPADRISINNIQAMDTNSLGIASSTLDTAANATASLQNIDNAIATVSQNRAGVGALENRFSSSAQNLSVAKENMMAADAQIRGLDYASEISLKSQNDVMLKAGVSALKSGLKTNEKTIGGLLNIKG